MTEKSYSLHVYPTSREPFEYRGLTGPLMKGFRERHFCSVRSGGRLSPWVEGEEWIGEGLQTEGNGRTTPVVRKVRRVGVIVGMKETCGRTDTWTGTDSGRTLGLLMKDEYVTDT